MIEILATVKGDKFCAGMVLWDDRVVVTAPILQRLKGMSRDRAREECKRRGWRVEVIHRIERAK